MSSYQSKVTQGQYHLNGLTGLGMSHSLDSLQSQSLHYGSGKFLFQARGQEKIS